MTNKFLKKEIALIKRRTHFNFHGENMEFVAKRVGSPLEKEFKKINIQHEKAGFLSYDLNVKRHNKFLKLKQELKKKLPKQNFVDVWGSM